MRFTKREISFFALLATAFVFVALFLFFSYDFAKISILEEPIELTSDSLDKGVSIYKNQYGIPHIIGQTENDAFFGLGFAQASDRLWQMDYFRRIAKGRLSEIFGKETIKLDQYFRTLEIETISKNIVSNLDAKSRSILESYSKGINLYIHKFSKRLPIEFSTLGYKPDDWTPEDCIAIGRLMAFNMSFSFWLDVAFGEISNKIGFERANALIPKDYHLPSISAPDTITKINKNSLASTNLNKLYRNPTSHSNYFEFFSLINRFFPFGTFAGSNMWVVQKEEGKNRTSILASDPHLALQLPPIWYQFHITSPELNCVGLGLPGIPLPLIGRNDNIAWGITVAMVDDCDFFAHKLDSTGRYVVDINGKRIKLTLKLDTIKVKKGTNFIYYKRYLGNSPIISDFLPIKDSIVATQIHRIRFAKQQPSESCLTYSWTGHRITNEVRALYSIVKAKNWEEFLRSKNFWGVPPLNFSFGDKYGNIGIMTAGLYPERVNVNPNFPNPTWHTNSSWIGFKKFEKEFNIVNPSSQFVFNANNPLVNSTTFISNYWSDPSRAKRLLQILSQSKPTDILANQVIQKDVFSEQAKEVLRVALPILISKQKYLNQTEKIALGKLEKWDFQMSSKYIASSIYQMFIAKLTESTFKDELGDYLYDLYTYADFIATRKIVELLNDSNSVFFDDIRTPALEDKAEIIFRSFKRTVAELTKITQSSNPEDWSYGAWHKVELEHPFARIGMLRNSFVLGPEAMGGNNSTLNYSGGHLFEPERVVVAPSARFIADMSDTLVWLILPGGNSGQNLSSNFSDQFSLWLNGGYISLPIAPQPSARFRMFTKITTNRNK
jgi:penicillin amidase